MSLQFLLSKSDEPNYDDGKQVKKDLSNPSLILRLMKEGNVASAKLCTIRNEES